nr:hypothetical protein [Kyrpidia tusciae]
MAYVGTRQQHGELVAGGSASVRHAPKGGHTPGYASPNEGVAARAKEFCAARADGTGALQKTPKRRRTGRM